MPLLALLLACVSGKDGDTAPVDTGGDTDTAADCPPTVSVTPQRIDLGEVRIGEFTIETVTVANTGCEALEIHGVSLDPPEANDVITISAIGSVLLPPGGSTTFTVRFDPLEPVSTTADVVIETNDPAAPTTILPLTGTGVAPSVDVVGSDCDFTDIPIGCVATCTVTVSNGGNDDLLVSDLDYVTASSELELDEAEDVNGPLPWSLAPGSSVAMTITYTPADTYADQGYVQVASDSPWEPTAQLSHTATAVDAAECP